MTVYEKSVNVLYYDGIINQPHQALLFAHEHGIVVHYQDHQRLYTTHDLTYIGAVGKILAAIELPHDARIEFLTEDVPDWLQLPHKRTFAFFHKIETSWRWIGLSFVMMVMILLSTFKWGIPYAAYQMAMKLPDHTLQRVGDQAQSFVVDYTEKSELLSSRQQQIVALYHANIQTDQPANILFRKGGERISANAFAIPNGTIMLTDELIKLTQNDQELIAVLAHEQGHLDDRHSLQQALRSLGLTLFYVAVTGDASDIVGGLPLAIVASNYSQEFELEADQRAVKELHRLKLSPKYMSDFLIRLTEQSGGKMDSSDFLASHPSTAKRVEQIQSSIQ